MVGILVQLALSWLIVWFFYKRNLSVLGLMPDRKRMIDFALFFLITAIVSASGYFLKMVIAKQQWQLNPQINWSLIAEGIWYNIKSVLYEELIFRGVLFYILIKKLGAIKAILISASAFGVYHWFTHNALGNPQAMIAEFIVTGAMGLVLASGYTKTESLYIPIAIHFGWNVVQQVVFSNGHIGNQLFIEVMPRPIVTISYFSYFFMQLFPLVSVLLINYWVIRKRET
jgi:membrane protease YdiL (CAAX protease family)